MKEIKIKITCEEKEIMSVGEGSDDLPTSKKIINYNVSIDNNFRYALEEKDINEIYNKINPIGFDATMHSFLQKTNKLDDSFIDYLKDIFNEDKDKKFLVSIISKDLKVLALPWEIVKLAGACGEISNNVILRRIKKDHSLMKNLLSKPPNSLFFSSINTSQNYIEDITIDLLREAMNFKKSFKVSKIYPDIDESQKEILLSAEVDIIHLAGHGDLNGLQIENGKYISKDDISSLNCKLLYLNFCYSGTGTLHVKGIINDIYEKNNTINFIICTRNKIGSSYASDFSKNFYENLQKSNDILESFYCSTFKTKLFPGRHDYFSVILYQK